jgi:hypothetical protein
VVVVEASDSTIVVSWVAVVETYVSEYVVPETTVVETPHGTVGTATTEEELKVVIGAVVGRAVSEELVREVLSESLVVADTVVGREISEEELLSELLSELVVVTDMVVGTAVPRRELLSELLSELLEMTDSVEGTAVPRRELLVAAAAVVLLLYKASEASLSLKRPGIGTCFGGTLASQRLDAGLAPGRASAGVRKDCERRRTRPEKTVVDTMLAVEKR